MINTRQSSCIQLSKHAHQPVSRRHKEQDRLFVDGDKKTAREKTNNIRASIHSKTAAKEIDHILRYGRKSPREKACTVYIRICTNDR